MTQRIVLSEQSKKYLPYAEEKLRELILLRKNGHLPFLQKPLFINGIYILLTSSDTLDRIVMWGGQGNVDHILFLSILKKLTTSYNYLTKKLTNASGVSLETINDIELSALFNGRLQVGEREAYEFGTSWQTKELDKSSLLTLLANIDNFEMSLFIDPALSVNIYARIKDSFGPYLTFPRTLLSFKTYIGSLLGLTGIPSSLSTSWNLYNPLNVYTLTPNSRALNPYWAWIPSFYVVFPADTSGDPVGFHYGKYKGVNEYGTLEFLPLSTAHVRFSGLVEQRFTSSETSLYAQGWAETVLNINGEGKNDLYFYFVKDLPLIGNETQTYLRTMGIPLLDVYVSMGADLKGFDKAFVLKDLDMIDPEIDMWSFSCWYNDNTTELVSNNAVGIVLSKGSIVRVYKYHDYYSLIFETTQYHSHAVSSNGQLLAVFEGVDIITRSTIIDLYGYKENIKKDVYISGGVTTLDVNETIGSLSALTADFIPLRENKFVPNVLPFDLNTSSFETPIDTEITDLSSMSFVNFKIRGDESPTIQKVMCTDGLNAFFSISVDDCFQSRFVLEDTTPENSLHLVGSWDAGGVNRARVRGSFIGSIGSTYFQGEGVAGPLGVATLADMGLYVYENGDVEAAHVLGDAIIGNCIVEKEDGGWEVDPSCADGCGGAYTLSASSTCGQTVTFDSPEVEISPLAINPKEIYEGFAEGNIYYVAGGGTSRTLSSTCDAISLTDTSSEAGITEYTITSIDLCSLTPESENTCYLIATDNCGSTQASLEGTVYGLDVLTLSGTEAPSVGSFYSASGGLEPYMYSISQGAIDSETGEVTDLTGACGMGIVTVTDSCNESVSIDVRMPTGKWIIVSINRFSDLSGLATGISGFTLPTCCVSNLLSGCITNAEDVCPSATVNTTTQTVGQYRYKVNNLDTPVESTVNPFTVGGQISYDNGVGCPAGYTQYWSRTARCVPLYPPQWVECKVEKTCSGTYRSYEVQPASITKYQWYCC